MIVRHKIGKPLPPLVTWDERWGSIDKGLITSWANGIEKANQDSDLRDAALRGELPRLAWQGGCGPKKLKLKAKFGAIQYLAMWQGLRGEDLHIDTEGTFTHECTKTGVAVTFTADLAVLATTEEEA